MIIERVILGIILLIIIILASAYFIYKLIEKKVGDCDIQWADAYFQVNAPEFKNQWEALIKFALPIKSTGKQQCILIDMFGRVHPEGDKHLEHENNVYIYPGGNRRGDHYWEAVLIKPGDTLIVNGELNISSQDRPIKELLGDMEKMKIDVYYKYYCRNLIKHRRKILNIFLSQLPGIEPGKGELEELKTIDRGEEVLPIRTPLLTSDDTLKGVFDKYVKRHLKEGDILAVCESALAIMEGRAHYVEDIQPGFLATHLNKLFKMDSSLSSPYSLEVAIREVGAVRIIFSVIMGGLGRLIGRAGDFYLFAGRAVATIDDCTGTLPPFDKYVVMGPKDPKKTARDFKKDTGVDLAVVDVNDLKRVDVLAVSDPSARELVEKALRDNPQGNANQQTPIALIRRCKE